MSFKNPDKLKKDKNKKSPYPPKRKNEKPQNKKPK